MYNSFYPKPRDLNLLAASSVTDVSGQHSFSQEEVELDLYSPLLREPINEIIKQSCESKNYLGIEVGFFAFITDKKPIVSVVTSNEDDRIFTEDLDRSFKECASQIVASQKIFRVQFYHTHPSIPSARIISRLDIDQAIKRSREVKELIGRQIPFDMHALPIDLSKDGAITYYKKPPLGKPTPPECKNSITFKCGKILLRATV